MPMFLDQLKNFKHAKEFNVFKIITTDFLDDINEKLTFICHELQYINTTPT